MKLNFSTPSDRMAFWFPVILPILMGLVLALAELVGDLAATALAMEPGTDESFLNFVKGDLSKLWLSSAKGLAVSVFAVDVWALSVLFSFRTAGQQGTAYAFPVLGIFGHFLLLLVVVGLGHLAVGFDVGAAIAEGSDGAWALAVRGLASVATLLSIWLAWIVRRGIWVHHETLATGLDAPAMQEKEEE